MVFLDGKKYACEACIKGHRSSSCGHTERPLFEIKKKGRPVTQCEHCRKLRKTKQVHVKCSCEAGTEEAEVRGKAKRKMPVSAAFPEGLKGAASSTNTSASPSPAPPKIKVSSSACDCKSTGRCGCATPITKPTRTRASSSDSSGPATPPPPAASSCCSGKSKSAPGPGPQIQHLAPPAPLHGLYPTQSVFDYAPPPAASYTQSGPYPAHDAQPADVYAAAPTFSWPPGGGVGICSCGVTCACPGCFEHANPSTALTFGESCPYACSTCSDCNGFGFAAPPAPGHVQDSGWGTVGGSGDGFSMFSTWPAPTPGASTSTSTPAAPSTPAVLPVSDCCGGSCKCSAEALACQCAAECCGCCFGCACSDENSEGTEIEDSRERLGFAVSGERGSCCSESDNGNGNGVGWDGDERRRKRRKLEVQGQGERECVKARVDSYSYRAIADAPTSAPTFFSDLSSFSSTSRLASGPSRVPSTPSTASHLMVSHSQLAHPPEMNGIQGWSAPPVPEFR